MWGIFDMNKSEYYGIIFTMLFNIGPLFQLWTITKHKSSCNVSIVMWVLGFIGQIFVLLYLFENNVTGIFNYINSGIGLLLSMIITVMILIYRNKK